MYPENGRNGTNGHVAAPSERRPPYNIEAEFGTLGSMMARNDLIPEIRALLKAEDFFRDAHGTLFRAICYVHDQGIPADCVTVADELMRRGEFDELGGNEFLAEIMNQTPEPANGKYHAGIVKEHAFGRSLLGFSAEIQNRVFSREYTAGELSDFAAGRIVDVQETLGEADEDLGIRPWPDDPDEIIYEGIAGDIVRLIAPHTEADPLAILGQFLVGFGSMVGRPPHWRVESTRHGANLYLCLVGNSSKARKGTSWDNVRWILARCDEGWAKGQVMNGLQSGEGMIWAIRDPIYRREKRQGGGGDYEEREVDPGVACKTALWVESEFGSTLSVLAREGNILNGVIRQFWDGGRVKAASKNNPCSATDPHVSIIAHITADELSRRLTQSDAANGFANRFLWVCARRSQYLPNGGRIHEVNFADVVGRLQCALAFARYEFGDCVPVLRDAAAGKLWAHVYPTLSDPKPGLLGAVASRAEAQVMRLALVYALLDCSKYIRLEHLQAALALWRYCEQSAAYIFGDALGDPLAEKLLQAIRDAGAGGMTLEQIHRRVLQRVPSPMRRDKLAVLVKAGLCQEIASPTGGRCKVWVASHPRKG